MAVPDAHIVTFPAESLRSLVWDGDDLVDWAGGGVIYKPTGERTSRNRFYAYAFDGAVADGRDAVIFARLNTKGLVLRDGLLLREIDRSFYCADAFDYPLAVFRRKDGRQILAHCPKAVDRLELEDFTTGDILTAWADRQPRSNFHGRLAASSDGRYLLSAGWAWQPYDDILVFDLDEALAEPSHLDSKGILPSLWSEMGACAAFSRDGRLIVGLNIDGEDRGSQDHTGLCVFDLDSRVMTGEVRCSGPIGLLMAIGDHHVLNLHGHPQLLDLATGEVVRAWPGVPCGNQISAIRAASPPFEHIAIDVDRMRCAIGLGDRITVIRFES